MNFRTRSILLISLLCSIPAEAGSIRASWSKVSGVFLGLSHEGDGGLEAYLEIRHPKEFINKFQNACAQKKQIWALEMSSKFICTKLDYVEEGGNGPVYELKLTTNGKREFSNHAVVFSLEPLTSHKTAERDLDPSEAQSLLSLYKSSSLRQVVSSAIKSGDVRILDFNKKISSIYVLKWKHVESEFSSNDYFLVINRDGEKFFSAGNFEGKVVSFVDINNDGIPEVQRSINCDGTCEAITSIYRNTRDLVSIYNH